MAMGILLLEARRWMLHDVSSLDIAMGVLLLEARRRMLHDVSSHVVVFRYLSQLQVPLHMIGRVREPGEFTNVLLLVARLDRGQLGAYDTRVSKACGFVPLFPLLGSYGIIPVSPLAAIVPSGAAIDNAATKAPANRMAIFIVLSMLVCSCL
ncbi:hypothetical protein K491DRAFT_393914 [Lophiostoma macrostomum CBS 122681]|uniref:Uncharacterized protein n=1 Tax=Lophiostoma macrostomum CBS 122681 TaxID=1314788 RepID=A0A6A6T9H0_9PLEO|nr:hypothetical protein K491DRAFT_393914 [Lophiostoma macrostomum CBS 122681]